MRAWMLVVVTLAASLACASDPAPESDLGDGLELVGDEPDEGAPDEAKDPRKHGRDRGKRGGRSRGGKGRSGSGPSPAPSPEPAPAPSPEPSEIVCTATGVYRACSKADDPKTCEDEQVEAKGPGSTRSAAETAAVEACSAHMDTMMSFAGSGPGSAEVKTPCAARSCD